MKKEQIEKIRLTLMGKTPMEVLAFAVENYGDKIAFASSLGAEDQVITDMLCQLEKLVRVFTLDTGRLFNETYETLLYTNARYGINIEVYFPEAEKVEKMVSGKGINLFYESIENRKLCCGIRKVDSLKRALNGMEAWITGIRREQSAGREQVEVVEWDDKFGLLKFNPIVDWTEEQVWQYIKSRNVPYNELHDKGYPSIGCAPCTRAITTNDQLRDGRWWWEQDSKKECGLHFD